MNRSSRKVLACSRLLIIVTAIYGPSLPLLHADEQGIKLLPQSSIPIVDLFRAGEGGYTGYRIPSIAVTPKGTLLVAVAARRDSFSDWADIDTMIRRSIDGGKTWEERVTITDEGEDTVDNATFIVDAENNKLFLMYQVDYERAYLKTSRDDGKSWSAPREITSVFEVFRERDTYEWEVLAMGPGHGIVLANGRYVVPIWIATNHSHRPSLSATIYSDDQGETWRAGEVIVKHSDQFANPSEHALVELDDGRVMTNVRTESKEYRRVISYSKDGATGWSAPRFHPELFDPICMASMSRYPAMIGEKPGSRILFCNPDSSSEGEVKRRWGARARKNVTIRVSQDEGKTWPVSRVIEPGPSGYSDITVADDGTIFVAFERGQVDDTGGFRAGKVSVAIFDMEWIMAGKD